MSSPHLLFNRNQLDAIILSDAHLRPLDTWLWRERLSRVLRGCCAGGGSHAHPFPCGHSIRIDSTPLEEAIGAENAFISK
jgi:hypothetical protein